MTTTENISDMLCDLSNMVSRAQGAWRQSDLPRLLDSLEQIASQAPQIVDAVYAVSDPSPVSTYD